MVKKYLLKKSPGKTQRLVGQELGDLLSVDQVSLQGADRLSYGRDSSCKSVLWVRDGIVKYPPDLIVWPEGTKQVSKVLRYAERKAIPVVPFGGGSGVCGGTWALKGGVALDLKRMDKILRIDSRKMEVQVQTGINGEVLERTLNGKGLTLGHFPASIYAATLGGFLACRSAGQYSTLYGKIEDMVKGLEVVLANGQVYRLDEVGSMPKALDLKEIFLGSEGVLGVMTEATLKVHPLPKKELFLGFSFGNLEKGISAARELLQRGLTPSLVRLYDPLDSLLAASHTDKEPGFPTSLLGRIFKPAFRVAKDYSLKVALKNPAFFNQLTEVLPNRCLLVLGFRGISSLIDKQARRAEHICRSFLGKNEGEKPGQYWLKHRYSVSYKLSPIFDEGFFADTMEVATTWKNIIPLYGAIREALGRHAIVMAHFSHAYAEGCSIYFTFLGHGENLQESESRYDKIWDQALKACTDAGGTISHHHGVGLLKSAYMKKEWGKSFEWLQNLKRTLDPKGILNPGKLGFPVDGES